MECEIVIFLLVLRSEISLQFDSFLAVSSRKTWRGNSGSNIISLRFILLFGGRFVRLCLSFAYERWLCTGCRNVSHCQQQSYSGLRSPGRSYSTYLWNDSWILICNIRSEIASHAGVFRGARFSSLPTKFVGRDEKWAPLKTPAWEARSEKELEPKCFLQLFLGLLLVTRRSAIGQFFPRP